MNAENRDTSPQSATAMAKKGCKEEKKEQLQDFRGETQRVWQTQCESFGGECVERRVASIREAWLGKTQLSQILSKLGPCLTTCSVFGLSRLREPWIRQLHAKPTRLLAMLLGATTVQTSGKRRSRETHVFKNRFTPLAKEQDDVTEDEETISALENGMISIVN